MSSAVLKAALAGLAIVVISNAIVEQLTDTGDSSTERLIWRAGSGALVAVAVAKFI